MLINIGGYLISPGNTYRSTCQNTSRSWNTSCVRIAFRRTSAMRVVPKNEKAKSASGIARRGTVDVEEYLRLHCKSGDGFVARPGARRCRDPLWTSAECSYP